MRSLYPEVGNVLNGVQVLSLGETLRLSLSTALGGQGMNSEVVSEVWKKV